MEEAAPQNYQPVGHSGKQHAKFNSRQLPLTEIRLSWGMVSHYNTYSNITARSKTLVGFMIPNNVRLGNKITATLPRVALKQVVLPATMQGMGCVCFNKFSFTRRKRETQGSKEDKG
jgi:hypothetical protein